MDCAFVWQIDCVVLLLLCGRVLVHMRLFVRVHVVAIGVMCVRLCVDVFTARCVCACVIGVCLFADLCGHVRGVGVHVCGCMCVNVVVCVAV